MSKPLRCRLRFHQWKWVGPPGEVGSYRRCRMCQKVRDVWGPDGAHDFYRSGMDDQSQDPRSFGGM